jgi:hypothetical protein
MSALGLFVNQDTFLKVLNLDTNDKFNNLDDISTSFAIFLKNLTIFFILFNILNVVIVLYAIYLSFKRNNGFKLLPFLAAVFLSIFYVIYAFAVPVKSLKKK